MSETRVESGVDSNWLESTQLECQSYSPLSLSPSLPLSLALSLSFNLSLPPSPSLIRAEWFVRNTPKMSFFDVTFFSSVEKKPG